MGQVRDELVRIGRLLGLTRQGARRKFPTAPPASPPHVVRRDRAMKEYRAGEVALRQFDDRRLTGPADDDPVFW